MMDKVGRPRVTSCKHQRDQRRVWIEHRCSPIMRDEGSPSSRGRRNCGDLEVRAVVQEALVRPAVLSVLRDPVERIEVVAGTAFFYPAARFHIRQPSRRIRAGLSGLPVAGPLYGPAVQSGRMSGLSRIRPVPRPSWRWADRRQEATSLPFAGHGFSAAQQLVSRPVGTKHQHRSTECPPQHLKGGRRRNRHGQPPIRAHGRTRRAPDPGS